MTKVLKELENYLELPNTVTTSDGITVKDGEVFVSVPNFSNDVLLKNNVIKDAPESRIIKFDRKGVCHDFYVFEEHDMQKDTKRVGPMELKFGPDGNLYISDMQFLNNKEYKSRLLRLNIKEGKAIDIDVLVEGFIVANGVAFNGNKIAISESILKVPRDGDNKLLSGVYIFDLSEFNDGKMLPIRLQPYQNEQSKDTHLSVIIKSENSKGFGSDGVVFDKENNLYTAVVENGEIYKTTFDSVGDVVKTELFVKDDMIKSGDGIDFDERTNLIYVANFFHNAIHTVDIKSKIVKTLFSNLERHDELHEYPAALAILDNKLLISRMDVSWLKQIVSKNPVEKHCISFIDISNTQ